MKVLTREVVERQEDVDPDLLIPLKKAADNLRLSINGLKGIAYGRGWTLVRDAERLDSFSDRTYLLKADVEGLAKERGLM